MAEYTPEFKQEMEDFFVEVKREQVPELGALEVQHQALSDRLVQGLQAVDEKFTDKVRYLNAMEKVHQLELEKMNEQIRDLQSHGLPPPQGDEVDFEHMTGGPGHIESQGPKASKNFQPLSFIKKQMQKKI